MNALLSIRPEFAFEIFRGTKQVEYRRTIFREPVKLIVVYASSPIKMVIGEFVVKDILFEDLDSLWFRTRHHSGISKELFYSYFSQKEKGYAIQVGKTTLYRTPRKLQDLYEIKVPPQSFTYIQT